MESRRTVLGAMTAASWSRVLGANERPLIGVIGNGGRGSYLMRSLKSGMDVQIGAVCDIYDVRREAALKLAGPQAQAYADHRQVLARNDIDAVIVATPDHWHAPIAVDACAAGKDVYIEKPMAHTPRDAQAIVKAAREHKRVIQVGTQGRVMKQNIDAREQYVRSGVMGTVGLARTWYNSNAGYVLKAPPGLESKPAGLDWERYLGRGPKIPWNPEVFFSPYKWLHYDGGMIMGIGIHVIDTAHFLLGLRAPKAVTASGGIYFHRDGRDTPDTIVLLLDYGNLTVSFEAEALTAPGVPTSAGVELRGSGGRLLVERYQRKDCVAFTANQKGAKTVLGDGSGTGAEDLLRNWIECIKTRARTIASETDAYYPTVACFMGNQAYRTQSRVTWDSKWDLPA